MTIKCEVCGEEIKGYDDGAGYRTAEFGYLQKVNIHFRCVNKCEWCLGSFVRVKGATVHDERTNDGV